MSGEPMKRIVVCSRLTNVSKVVDMILLVFPLMMLLLAGLVLLEGRLLSSGVGVALAAFCAAQWRSLPCNERSAVL